MQTQTHRLNLVVSVEVDDAGDRGPVVLHVPEVPPEVAVLPVYALCYAGYVICPPVPDEGVVGGDAMVALVQGPLTLVHHGPA